MHHLSKKDNTSLQIWLNELKEFQLDSLFDTAVLGRAYLYIESISINGDTEHHVGASVNDGKYDVSIQAENNSVLAECSCPYQGNCKHLAALLLFLINRGSKNTV